MLWESRFLTSPRRAPPARHSVWAGIQSRSTKQERPYGIFAALDHALRAHGKVRHTDFVLKFWPDQYEITLFPDGRAIIKGTADPGCGPKAFMPDFLGT